jgi:preprotein translocase subunit YajC
MAAGRLLSRGTILEEVIVLGSLSSLAASSASSSGGGYSLLIFLVLMGAVFYFLLIRPQQRRQRQQRQLIESVEVGDEVMTIGGMYGTVREVDDDSITVEVAPNVDIRFSKSAIARKLVYDEDEYEDEEDDDGAGDEPEASEHREAGDQS